VHRPLPKRRAVAERPSTAVAVLIAAWLLAAVRPASAVVRTCGPDPIANTADVLCAPPSGPCTDTLVVLGANVTMRGNMCTFDLAGRALRIERTLRAAGHDFLGSLDGGIVVRNAGDVTITRHGKLKARGDLVQPAGNVIGGGLIDIASAGTVVSSGLLDVAGDIAGRVQITAAGDVMLDARSRTRAPGISSLRDEGGVTADGGTIVLQSNTGSIRLQGLFAAPGGAQAYGGEVGLFAGRDVELTHPIDLSGGAGGGGALEVVAGDDVRISASIDAQSRSGGDFGGDIEILAGDTPDATMGMSDGKPFGDLEIAGATIDVRGSASNEGFSGDGGTVDLEASGSVRIAHDVVVHASAANLPDGNGGFIVAIAGSGPGSPIAPDSDLHFSATVTARGTSFGGDMELFADRYLILDGPADLSGDYGGDLFVIAGRNATIASPVRIVATQRDGTGGAVELTAGDRDIGTLRIADDIIASGGANGECAGIRTSSCALTVDPGVTLDASCATPDQMLGLETIRLAALSAIDLGAGPRFRAAPLGRVLTVHPPGVTPTVGAGALFTAGRTDREDSAEPYPSCGR